MKQRDRNEICLTCIHHSGNQCRRNAPVNIYRKGEFQMPGFDIKFENKYIRVEPMGLISGVMTPNSPWPIVGDTEWCSQWSDGTCEFCGRKEL